MRRQYVRGWGVALFWVFGVGVFVVATSWIHESRAEDTHDQSGNTKLLSQGKTRNRKVTFTQGASCKLVWFTSLGTRLAGHLCLPKKRSETIPGVVVLGSWTTVKEQMAGLYARKLAASGLAALAFDPYGYGESAGTPRDVEAPQRKILDVKAAAAFLAQHKFVKKNVGALGICAGSSYVAGAAAGHSTIRSVALVAPWLHDAAMVRLIYGGKDGVAKRLGAAQRARQYYLQTGKVVYVPASSQTNKKAAMYGAFDYYLNPKRGKIEAWSNRFAVMAWKNWLTFDPHPFAAKISHPTLLIHSKNAALPQGASRFFSNLKGKKQLHWMPGSQFHFYDDPKTVNAAVTLLVQHFQKTL
ncbi:MAG: alpha/beta hydrolase [Deltaproteobacteria bacterium]|nr:MAG: alpha/beta hydrolase [Deltaproteobacteria bacterium]